MRIKDKGAQQFVGGLLGAGDISEDALEHAVDAETGEIVFVQPAFDPRPGENEGLFFAAGAMSAWLKRPKAS